MRLILLGLVGMACAVAQDPFAVARDHYRLEFENPWVRVVRVTYGPRGTAPVHDHPSLPTVYVYVTDGGPMRFTHTDGRVLQRPAVKAGGIRFAPGSREAHRVESLGDQPSEYVRVEMKTEPLGQPMQDVRLPPLPLTAGLGPREIRYENGQLRIVRVVCATGQPCPPAPPEPAVVLFLAAARWQVGDGLGGVHAHEAGSGHALWSPEGTDVVWQNAGERPMEMVRVELKSSPRR